MFLFIAAGSSCRSHAQAEDTGAPIATEEAAAVTQQEVKGTDTPVSKEGVRSALVEPGTPEAKIFPTVFRILPPPYEPGEDLTFSFKWSGIAAGRASYKVLDVLQPFKGHKVIKLDSLIESNAFAGMFYSVHDHSYSLVDVEKGFSRFYYLDKREDRHQYLDTVEYDYEQGVAHYNRHEKGKDNPKDFPLYGPVSDVMSVIYYYRQIPKLSVGDTINLPLSTEKEIFLVRMVVDGKDMIKVRNLGTVRALKISPAEDVKNGPAISNMGSSMWIEEVTHIPLRVTIDLSFGSITMYLVEANNVTGLKALTPKEIKTAKKDGY